MAYNNNKNYDGAIVGAAIFGLIILIIICPFLYFISGWITGWLIQLIFAPTFIRGLSLIGINISADSIPLFCGTLGVIGSFFKTYVKSKN